MDESPRSRKQQQRQGNGIGVGRRARRSAVDDSKMRCSIFEHEHPSRMPILIREVSGLSADAVAAHDTAIATATAVPLVAATAAANAQQQQHETATTTTTTATGSRPRARSTSNSKNLRNRRFKRPSVFQPGGGGDKTPNSIARGRAPAQARLSNGTNNNNNNNNKGSSAAAAAATISRSLSPHSNAATGSASLSPASASRFRSRADRRASLSPPPASVARQRSDRNLASNDISANNDPRLFGSAAPAAGAPFSSSTIRRGRARARADRNLRCSVLYQPTNNDVVNNNDNNDNNKNTPGSTADTGNSRSISPYSNVATGTISDSGSLSSSAASSVPAGRRRALANTNLRCSVFQVNNTKNNNNNNDNNSPRPYQPVLTSSGPPAARNSTVVPPASSSAAIGKRPSGNRVRSPANRNLRCSVFSHNSNEEAKTFQPAQEQQPAFLADTLLPTNNHYAANPIDSSVPAAKVGLKTKNAVAVAAAVATRGEEEPMDVRLRYHNQPKKVPVRVVVVDELSRSVSSNISAVTGFTSASVSTSPPPSATDAAPVVSSRIEKKSPKNEPVDRPALYPTRSFTATTLSLNSATGGGDVARTIEEEQLEQIKMPTLYPTAAASATSSSISPDEKVDLELDQLRILNEIMNSKTPSNQTAAAAATTTKPPATRAHQFQESQDGLQDNSNLDELVSLGQIKIFESIREKSMSSSNNSLTQQRPPPPQRDDSELDMKLAMELSRQTSQVTEEGQLGSLLLPEQQYNSSNIHESIGNAYFNQSSLQQTPAPHRRSSELELELALQVSKQVEEEQRLLRTESSNYDEQQSQRRDSMTSSVEMQLAMEMSRVEMEQKEQKKSEAEKWEIQQAINASMREDKKQVTKNGANDDEDDDELALALALSAKNAVDKQIITNDRQVSLSSNEERELALEISRTASAEDIMLALELSKKKHDDTKKQSMMKDW